MRALRDATPDELLAELTNGRAQLWLAFDGDDLKAACVTQTSGDTLHFWLCAGDGCNWRNLGDKIADAARGQFKRMTIDGRPGWARVLGFAPNVAGLLERAI